jgi:biopolymer transport protein ExbD
MPSSFFRPCRRSSTSLAIAALAAMMSGPTTRAEPPAERVSPRSVEFEGVQDRVPLGFRDYAALIALSRQARTGLTADVIKAARHDVGLGELLNQSAKFRGELIDLRGLARRRYSALELGGRKGLFEVWITVPTEGLTPIACVLEKLPEEFPRREDISEPVVFRGFFLKVITYLAGDVWREAPLLIGRMETLPDRQAAGPPPAGPNNRLPSASAFENRLWLTEDRIPIELVRQDRLIVDGQPIARDALAPRLAALAERTRRNAQAVGIAIESAEGLPAALIIRASAETPFAAITQIINTGDASRFRRFQLHLNTDQDQVAPQGPARRVRAVEQRPGTDLPETIRTVPILLLSDGAGQIGRAEIGENILQGFAALDRELGSMFTDPDLPFDRVKLEVDPNLHYSEVVRLNRVLAGLNVTSISVGSADK